MKKFLAFAITAAMLLSLAVIGTSAAEVYDGASVSASLSGSGTEADPYLIANGADLAYFASAPVDGASYKLTADIVWSSYTKDGTAPEASNWTAIASFNGTFDGDGHSISGLYIKGEKNAAFIASATGTIKNLTIKDSSFEGTKYVAGIVGQLEPGSDKATMPSLTIENCVSDVDLCATKKNALIGSMVGDAFGNANTPTYAVVTISGCVNYGKITTTAADTMYTGGIVGRTFGCPAIVENCANFGDIETLSPITGGIVGQSGINAYAGADHSTTISNCYNAGNITGLRICGGIIGRAYPGTSVSDCVNVGNVSNTISVEKAGANDGYFDQLGPITGHGSDTRADAASYNNCGVITNCYTSADVVLTSANDATAAPFYASVATVKTAAELNSDALVSALGDAWTLSNGALTLKILATESTEPEVTEPEVTEPEVTEPEITDPVDPVPTGDSAVIFAVIAVISVLGVAVVAKRRE